MHIRDRIKELRRVPAGELRPNPRNWRLHPPAQHDALRAVLSEVGYAGALLARELDDGSLMLIDGHLRAETTPDAIVPVLVLDVDEAEANKILLTFDPLSALSTVSQEPFDALLGDVQIESSAVRDMLSNLGAEREAKVQLADQDLAPNYPEARVPGCYQVVVECRDEQDQEAVFQQMRSAGYRCRVLTL